MPPTRDLFMNPSASGCRLPPVGEGVLKFHQSIPGYQPTPLTELPQLAADLGVGRVFVKDESERLGLPAFKILGASYAVARILGVRWNVPDDGIALDDLVGRATDDPTLELFCATDGNHGRAVAHIAAMIGIPCTVYYPSNLTAEAKAAIAAEGAAVVELDIEYDDVVTEMALAASTKPGAEIVQDTAWSGYVDPPQWIVDGYSTMMREIDAQLRSAGVNSLDLVTAPAGVGSLAQAVVQHYKSTAFTPKVLIIEPEVAPAIFTSLTNGEVTPVSTGETIMKGLNCGTPSSLAFPVLAAGADAAVLVSENDVRTAIADLWDAGVNSGPCGAATLAGARNAIPQGESALQLASDAVVLLLNTESREANPSGLEA